MMKKIMILVLFISFIGCKHKNIKQRIKENNFQKQIDNKIEIEPTYTIEGIEILPEDDVEIGSEEWIREAELYLELEEGDAVYDFDNKKRNTKNPNKVVYSTKDIEYSEEWKVRAYKATKKHLKKVIPSSLPNCYINSFGYYNSSYVKYIGNNTFRVKVDLTFKCGKDNYENRKYFCYETGYSEHTNQFEFYFMKEVFSD